MTDHNELVSEMLVLEQMGTQERQKLAKKRRLQQLKKWSQREKEFIAKEKQINKRLASMISEENNGLNLKHYTSYNSNTRNKPKMGTKTNPTKPIQPDNNNLDDFKSVYPNGKSLVLLDNQLDTAKKLAPHGKVHFNVGVMLLEAAARNDYDEVKRLLMLGVSPDSINHDGLTALHQCCIDASEPMMKLLLEFGAQVDARDTEQWTPLHAACTCGHLNLVKILVEHGANLLAVNGDGNMPFDACEDESTLSYIESQMVERGITQEMIDITRASTEMQMISDLEALLADGVDLREIILNKKDNVSLLHVAAANGYLSAVKYLLKHGANVNLCDSDLWTPLHGAACWGNEQHIKIVELLIESGAKLDAKTINDETVFDLCDNEELLERLNQIKDEIESKQAAAAAAAEVGADDRLKRSQSRTNSRVHSVRRTSVRDKNQISRREAREEAMLRNESNASLDKSSVSGSASSQPAPTANGLTDVVRTSHADIGRLKEPVSQIKQTDLDQPDDGNQQQQQHQPEEHNTKNPRSQETSGTNGVSSCTMTKCDSNHPSDIVEKQSSAPSKDKLESISAGDKSKVLIESSNNKRVAPSTTITLLNGSERPSGTNKTMSNGNLNHRLATDSTDGAPDNQQTSNVAFITPINYTLSNLKKQRSDLRMRNSTIGGGSITTTTTIKTPNGIALSATAQNLDGIVDTNPMAVNGTDTELRLSEVESPSGAIRKFSGEPSETVGGGKKRRRAVCCIVI